jgi:hypothetical protein
VKLTRKRCDDCAFHVAKTWFARHVASDCRVARGVRPPTPKFWLDGSLRLRPFETLARNGSYYGVRALRQRKSRRWEPV